MSQSSFPPPQSLAITYSQISTLSINVVAFRTTGYSTPGDGGDAIYIHGSSSGPMAVQDASGQWWELARTGVWSCISWGAKGDNSTDTTTALNAWLAACVFYGQEAYAPPGIYRHSGLLLNASSGVLSVALRGAHPSQTIFRTINGTTNPILSITTGSGGYGSQPQPTLRDFTLDGNNGNSGHGIALSGPGVGYGEGFLGINVTVLKAGGDSLYIGANAGAGCLNRCFLAHPGRNSITFMSGDWRITDCDLGGAELAGTAVKGAVGNGSGLIRLNAPSHGMVTNQTAYITSVQGTVEAIGIWSVTVIDANTLDLQGSAFVNTYTGLGRCVPLLTVSTITNSGGLVQVAFAGNHNLTTGAQLLLQNCGGVPNANGGWWVTYVDAATVTLNGSQFAGTYTSGGTGWSFTANIFIPSNGAPASNEVQNCAIYTGMFGVVITSASKDCFQLTGGSIDTHWCGGIAIQTSGIAVPHFFTGPVRMSQNSQLLTGTFPDILLSNTAASRFEVAHAMGSSLASYLVSTDNTCVGPVFWTPNFDESAHKPYAISATNLHSDANLPYGAWASVLSGVGNTANSYSSVGGSNNTASGQNMLVYGANNVSSGSYGATLGRYGNDKGETSLVWGGSQFSTTGDNQVRLVTAGCITTNATPTRLLVQNATPASATNSLNLFFNYQSMAYDRITIMCKNPATGDTKTWVIDNLVAKRGSSASAITLNGSGSTINPSATYSADSALSGCTVSLAPDTTYGGIAVLATGIAATTLHWSLKAMPLEVV